MDIHGDHLSAEVIGAVKTESTTVIGPKVGKHGAGWLSKQTQLHGKSGKQSAYAPQNGTSADE